MGTGCFASSNRRMGGRMQEIGEIKRFGKHRNAFGFLRLLFASLVIVSHTPEMADGNRSREILTQLFGTISFGELAVDGFFIISGYLVVGSYLKQPHFLLYLEKRIKRIYPAFIAAWLFVLFIVAPLAGAKSSDIIHTASRSVYWMAVLGAPIVHGVFAGTPQPGLDNPMWTIAFEFRCYLLVLALGLVGAFRRPWIVLALAVALLCAFELLPGLPVYLVATLRLTGIFLAGSLFYLWRDSIRFTNVRAALAAIGMVSCLFVPKLAEPGLAVFGAYVIFAIALGSGAGALTRINNRYDISYGVYLYAAPAEGLLLWYWPTIPLPLAALLTFSAACICGWISWHALEKPIMLYRRSTTLIIDLANKSGYHFLQVKS